MKGRPLTSLTNQTIHAYLDAGAAQRTRTLASETGHSLSSIINDALKLYFARLDLIESIDHDSLL